MRLGGSLEVGDPPAHRGTQTADMQPGCGILGCTACGEAMCLPKAALATLSLLQRERGSKTGKGLRPPMVISPRHTNDGTLLSQCLYRTPAGGIEQLDREAYNPSHFVALAMPADCSGPSYHEVIRSKASMTCSICSSKLCSLVIP